LRTFSAPGTTSLFLAMIHHSRRLFEQKSLLFINFPQKRLFY
jgi:hypothetical protein